MVRHKKPPSQSRQRFLRNHCTQTASIDFFTVPINITTHPSAQWTSQQITEAFPYDEVPKYLIRDRDAIFGNSFQK